MLIRAAFRVKVSPPTGLYVKLEDRFTDFEVKVGDVDWSCPDLVDS